MGMTNAPVGFGMWIAFQNTIGSIEESIVRLKDCGAKWVAPRAGGGRSRDASWQPAFAREAIKKYHDAGLKVYPWMYSMPSTCQAELAIYKALMDEGADGVFIDAELEWQNTPGVAASAEDFLTKLRALLGDECFIGHAPFPYLQWHAQFPYEQFGKHCDQVHPQTYWSEISNATAEKHIAAIQAQWDAVAKATPDVLGTLGRVCHIGVTYGKEIGGPTPGQFRPSDLAYFMKWCKEKELPCYSAYSLDAMNPLARTTLKAINEGTPIPQDPGTPALKLVPSPAEPVHVPDAITQPTENPAPADQVVTPYRGAIIPEKPAVEPAAIVPVAAQPKSILDFIVWFIKLLMGFGSK